MCIISINLNGIRSAAGKGFYEWLARQDVDIVFRLLKAQARDMTAQMLAPQGYHGCFHYAQKKRYSGVGMSSPLQPLRVVGKTSSMRKGVMSALILPVFPARYRCTYPRAPAARNARPSSSNLMAAFMPHLNELRKSGREVVICGDRHRRPGD